MLFSRLESKPIYKREVNAIKQKHYKRRRIDNFDWIYPPSTGVDKLSNAMSAPTHYASVADTPDITTMHDLPDYAASLYHV